MRLFRRRIRDKPEKRSSELDDFIKGADVDMGGVASGVHVDEDRAMLTSSVYACVILIAEMIVRFPTMQTVHSVGGWTLSLSVSTQQATSNPTKKSPPNAS